MFAQRREMTEVRRTMMAPPERVFAELADGWAYVGWVVGATHIRDVDSHWPEVGSRIHHMVGSWPLLISDITEVLECDPGVRLLLRAKGWPVGEAIVELAIRSGEWDCSEVSLREAPTAGPGRWLDNPVLRGALKLRNAETLRRLADRVEHRALAR